MLTLFRSNQAYAGILLFGYALLLQLPFFIWGGGAQVQGAEAGAAGEWLLGWFAERGALGNLLALLFPVLLVGFQGIIASGLTADHRMARRVTQFAGVFVVLLWALVPAAHFLNPYLFANLFLLLAIGATMSVYQQNESGVAQFNVGAWLALSALFVPNYLLFLPAFWIGTSILRTLNLRVIFQTLTGLALVFFLTGTVAYVWGNFGEFWRLQLQAFGPFDPAAGWGGWYAAVPLGVLLMISLLTNGQVKSLLNIEGSKNVQFAAALLLFSALVVGLGGPAGPWNFQVLQIPLGLLIGLWFVRLDNGVAEFLHLLLFATAVGLCSWALVA